MRRSFPPYSAQEDSFIVPGSKTYTFASDGMWYQCFIIVMSFSRIFQGGHALAWSLLSFVLFLQATGAQAQLPSNIGFSPAVGAPGTSVHITGNNLGTAVSLTFNTVPAVFYMENNNSIYATVPEGALSGPISVNNLTGGASSSSSFTVSPRLTELTPGRGLVGTNVVVKGANLTGTTAVYFGDVAAAFLVTSDTQLTAQVPTGATNAPVKIVTPAGTAVTTNSFLVTGAPLVSSFTPSVALRNTQIVVEGENFGTVTNVLVNGVVASGFQVALNQILVTIPSSATSGPLTVQNASGSYITTTNLITGPAPIVTGFSPAGASTGSQVTITGVGFTSATTVQFNGVTASFNRTADNQITATVPASATTGPIRVFVNSTFFTTSSNFVVGPLPKITDVNVSSGSVGTQVYISGQNLLKASGLVVRFNETAVSSITESGAGGSQIQVNVPTGATSGYITASNSVGIATSPAPFTVVGTAPVILDFSPKSGSTNSVVTLYGFGFSGVTAVKLNGVAVQSFTVTSTSGTNQMVITNSTSATTGPLSVTTSGGTATTADKFYVWPRVSGFTPTLATAGTSVTISGANFTDASEVRLNDVPGLFAVNSSSQITFSIPARGKSGPLTIKTPAGLVTTISNLFMAPKIDTLIPDRGRASDTVIIDGSGFFNVNRVKFNGLDAAYYTNDSVNRITAVAPTGVDSGNVEVTTLNGVATSPSPFLVYATITSFSPKSGSVGDTVQIDGLNFSGVTNVLFSGVTANFTLVSPTRLQVTLPTANTGPLVLQNPAGNTTSSGSFEILPSLQILNVDGTKVILQWPAVSLGYQLQTLTALETPIVWVNENSPKGTNNGFIQVTNTFDGNNRFYRLKKDL